MFDKLQNKLTTFAKQADETVSMLGTVLVAVPLAAVIALVFGLLLSSASVGFVVFFIALAALIVWFRSDGK